MDDADRASELEQRQRDAALAGARARRAALPPTGACYNCSAPLAGGRVFCDGECRDDYEARRRAMERS